MAAGESELLLKEDFEGNTFKYRRYVTNSGDVITCPPAMVAIQSIVANLDSLEVKRDDVILASYPKAGSSWMYETLSMLLKGEAAPNKAFKLLDFIDMAPSFDALNNSSSGFRILNTHMLPKYLPEKIIKQQKIVQMARNPKSIAVSHYLHTLKLRSYAYEGTFHGYLPTYLEGYHTLYGNWFEYNKAWWNLNKKHSNIYVIFYEDLKKEPEIELTKLSRFLGRDYSPDFIANVAELISFETMKEGVGKDKKALEFMDSFSKNGESFLIRKGSIQDWKNHFTVKENEDFDQLYNEKMKEYPDLKARITFE